MTMHIVTDTATGRILRSGHDVDFENDGSFDSSTESYRTDAPDNVKASKLDDTSDHDIYNGFAYETVSETTPEKLIKYKKKKRKKITNKTYKKLSEGFSHNGKHFSCIKKAQDFIAHMKQFIDKSKLFIPLQITTIEDETYVFNTIEDFNLFVDTVLGTVKNHKDEERPIKQQLFAATDIAAVDAILDER
jgi:hypothetical protein